MAHKGTLLGLCHWFFGGLSSGGSRFPFAAVWVEVFDWLWVSSSSSRQQQFCRPSLGCDHSFLLADSKLPNPRAKNSRKSSAIPAGLDFILPAGFAPTMGEIPSLGALF